MLVFHHGYLLALCISERLLMALGVELTAVDPFHFLLCLSI